VIVCTFITIRSIVYGTAYSQSIPHSVAFRTFHADDTEHHDLASFGMKLQNFDAESTIYYYNYPAHSDSIGLVNYDQVSGEFIVNISRFEDWNSGDLLKFNFVGDYDSELELILEKSSTSFTNGGDLVFGYDPHEIVVSELSPAVGSINISENDLIAFSVVAEEPMSNPITYVWFLNDSVVSISSSYSYQTDLESSGTHIVKLNLDNNYNSNSMVEYSWTVTVTDVDQDIVVNSLAPAEGSVTINEMEEINFAIDATDPDGNDLGYSWKMKKGTDDFVEQSTVATYDFTTDYASAGTYTVTLDLTDNFGTKKLKGSEELRGTKNSLSYFWTVTVDDVDQDIVVNSLAPAEGSVTINEMEEINFAIDATDPDGNDLGYSWKMKKGTDDFVEQSTIATYDFTTDYASAGTYIVTLDLTDNFGAKKLKGSEELRGTKNSLSYFWTVTVTDVDQDIVVNSLAPVEGAVTISEMEEINFAIDATDPDGNDLGYSWKMKKGEEAFVEQSTVATYDFTTDYASAGTYTVTLDLTDNFGAKKLEGSKELRGTKNSLSYFWTVTVADVSPLIPNNISISVNSSRKLLISWDEITDASYILYAGDDPYGEIGSWEIVQSALAINEYSTVLQVDDSMKFYRIASEYEGTFSEPSTVSGFIKYSIAENDYSLISIPFEQSQILASEFATYLDEEAVTDIESISLWNNSSDYWDQYIAGYEFDYSVSDGNSYLVYNILQNSV